MSKCLQTFTLDLIIFEMILGFIFFLWESGDQRHSHVLIDLKPLILSFFVCVCVCLKVFYTHSDWLSYFSILSIWIFIYLLTYLFLNSATLQPKKHSEYEILWKGSTNSTKIPHGKLDQKLTQWISNKKGITLE